MSEKSNIKTLADALTDAASMMVPSFYFLWREGTKIVNSCGRSK
jgi:hypothetical protein